MTISHGRRQWGVIPQLPLVSSCSKWMMVCSLSPAMWCSGLSIHGPRRRVREHLRKSSNTLNKRNCEYNCTHTVTAQQVSFECLWRSPGQRFVLGVEETAHFSTARTWSSMKLFWWEGKRQRKDCIPIGEFPCYRQYVERLARLKQVPMFKVLVRPGRDSNNDLPDTKRAL